MNSNLDESHPSGRDSGAASGSDDGPARSGATSPAEFQAQVVARYHVPRSQVWPGSRGRQQGKVHLHVLRGPLTFTAANGRTISRGGGVALCGKVGWYERPGEPHEEHCPRCAELAERYRVPWPPDGVTPEVDLSGATGRP